MNSVMAPAPTQNGTAPSVRPTMAWPAPLLLDHHIGEEPEDTDRGDAAPQPPRAKAVAEHLAERDVAVLLADEPLLVPQHVPENGEDDAVHQPHHQDPLGPGGEGDVRPAEEGKGRQQRRERREQEDYRSKRPAREVVVLGGAVGQAVGDDADGRRDDHVSPNDSQTSAVSATPGHLGTGRVLGLVRPAVTGLSPNDADSQARFVKT